MTGLKQYRQRSGSAASAVAAVVEEVDVSVYLVGVVVELDAVY